jgi:hypothetical protein
MPDDFEALHGLLSGTNDAGLDRDGDGMTNLEEYLAGTSPSDGSDFFRALSAEKSGDVIVITFRVAPHQTYQIRSSLGLEPSEWHLLPALHHTTSDSLQVTLPATTPKGFFQAFRVE